MPIPPISDTRRRDEPKQKFGPGKTSRNVSIRAVSDITKDHGDPFMIRRIMETVERFPEGQIPDDIEGCEVIPSNHVQRFVTSFAVLVQTLYQKINIAIDQRLLDTQ